MNWEIRNRRDGVVESGRAVVVRHEAGGPPLLAGHETEETRQRVESFYGQVAEIFERWVTRSASQHTQRAYRWDVLTFVEFMDWVWLEEGWRFLTATIGNVSSWRELMIEQGRAPKTINRRLASVSSFYKFLAGCASEARLPITVPNPAHVQFVQRLGSDPVHETQSLSATRARQLMGLFTGEEATMRVLGSAYSQQHRFQLALAHRSEHPPILKPHTTSHVATHQSRARHHHPQQHRVQNNLLPAS